jgi:hypothetical protein
VPVEVQCIRALACAVLNDSDRAIAELRGTADGRTPVDCDYFVAWRTIPSLQRSPSIRV